MFTTALLRLLEAVVFGEWALGRSMAIRGFYWDEVLPHISAYKRRYALKKRGDETAIFFCECELAVGEKEDCILYRILVPQPWHEALEILDPFDETKPEEFIIRISLLRHITVRECALRLARTFAEHFLVLRVKRA